MTTEAVRLVRCSCGLPVEDHLTHYVVVRRDLPFGIVLAQITHAAGESFYKLADVAQADKSSGVVNPQVARSNRAVGSSSFPGGNVPRPERGEAGSTPAPGAIDGGTGPGALLVDSPARRESPAVASSVAPAASETGRFNPSETYAIVLGARNESKLLKLERSLLAAGVPHVAVREPDAPYNGALMAIGVVPGKAHELRRHLNDFHMLRELDAPKVTA